MIHRPATSAPLHALWGVLTVLLAALPVFCLRAADAAARVRVVEQAWEKKAAGSYYVLTCEVNYPNKSELTYQLRFGTDIVENSMGRAAVKDGRIRARMGPFSKTLFHGTYDFEVHFMLAQQPATLYYEIEDEKDHVVTVPQSIGTPEGEEQETLAFREALQQYVNEAAGRYGELLKKFEPVSVRRDFCDESGQFDSNRVLDYLEEFKSRVPELLKPLAPFTEGVAAPKCPVQCRHARRFLNELVNLADLETASLLESRGLSAPVELTNRWRLRPTVAQLRGACDHTLAMLKYYLKPEGKDPALAEPGNPPVGPGGTHSASSPGRVPSAGPPERSPDPK